MIGPRINWSQFTDGETHELTAGEIRRKYGRSLDQFRSSLRSHCNSRGMKCSTRRIFQRDIGIYALRFRVMQNGGE